MSYYKKLFRYTFPYKWYAFANVVSNVLYALFSVLSYLSLIPMIEVLFGQTEPVHERPVWNGMGELKQWISDSLNYHITAVVEESGKISALMYMVALIIAVFLLKNLFGYLAKYFIAFLRNGVLRDLRNDLYVKAVNLPVSYYSERQRGDMMTRLTSDVTEVQYSMLTILELIVRDPMTIIFTLVAMFMLSVKLSLFVLLCIPVSGLLISRIGKRLKRDSDTAQREMSTLMSVIGETLSGLKVIKGFNAEAFFIRKFRDSTQRYYRISNRLLHRQNLASPLSEVLGIVVIALLLWYGGRLVFIEEALSPSVFIGYLALAYNILTPAKAISRASYALKRAKASAERVFEVMDTPNPLEDKENAVEIEGFDKEIVFDNISFKYEEQWVLKDFNLTIEKGKTVALVGQSGSGKSTLAALLTRFYDVQQGRITIDGHDIRDLTKKSLRSLMGLVTQEAILFHDTVRNNILFGNTTATGQDVIRAAKIANAHDFIMKLPKGYDTDIGDAGNKLSGGQKQRISIARAVLKNPPIMILDEATSALDTESEHLVQEALEYMMRNSTSLVIAHRLSTVKNADMIVVMKDGKIIEQGTHESLIAANGNYKKLVELQEL